MRYSQQASTVTATNLHEMWSRTLTREPTRIWTVALLRSREHIRAERRKVSYWAGLRVANLFFIYSPDDDFLLRMFPSIPSILYTTEWIGWLTDWPAGWLVGTLNGMVYQNEVWKEEETRFSRRLHDCDDGWHGEKRLVKYCLRTSFLNFGSNIRNHALFANEIGAD